MKILKICIVALTIGLFNTSCKNNENCTTTNTDSSATTVSTVNAADGTNAMATSTTDTSMSGKMNDSTATTRNVKGSGTEVIYVNGRHKMSKSDTLASKGPDLKASKKREKISLTVPAAISREDKTVLYN